MKVAALNEKQVLLLTAALLAAVVFIAYTPALTAGFIWDDNEFVTENPDLDTLSGLKTIWLHPKDNPHYFPLLMTVFWLLRQVLGVHPTGYHLVTLAFHIGNVLLVWLILRRLGERSAVLAALVFGLHPVHAQSVAWVTELKNTLSGCFFLGALWTWLRLDDPAGRVRGWGGYAASLGLFACALLSKTTVVSLPLALLLIELWRRGRLPRRTIAFALAMAVVAVLPVLVTVNLEQSRNVEGLSAVFTTGERWLVAGRSFWFYLGKLFWPAGLMMIYPPWPMDAALVSQYVPLLLALLLVAGLWAGRRAWGRAPGLGALFFAATVMPIPFLDINFVLQHAFMADHFLYLPSLGILPVAAAGLYRLAERLKRPGAAFAVPLVLGALTWAHARVFRDPGTLWRDVLARNPYAPAAHNNLGLHLSRQGDPVGAIEQFRQALRLHPGSSKAWNNMATELLRIGEEEQALAALRKAVELNPAYFEAHNNLAALLSKRGALDEALVHLRRALELKPDYFEGYYNLGSLLAGAGRPAEALPHMRRALAMRPQDAGVVNNLSRAISEGLSPAEAAAELRTLAESWPGHLPLRIRLAEALGRAGDRSASEAEFEAILGQFPGSADTWLPLAAARQRAGADGAARDLLEKAVTAEPDNPAAIRALAWRLATHPDAGQRDGARAAALARQACERLSYNDYGLLDALAAALAEAGQFDEARRIVLLAARQAPPGAPRAAVEARGRLYEQERPYRDLSLGGTGGDHGE